MANTLSNMLKLQTNYHIPMRMDLSIRGLINYYNHHYEDFDPTEKSDLIKEIVNDLQQKLPNI